MNVQDTKGALKLIVEDIAGTLLRQIDELNTESDLDEMTRRLALLPQVLTPTFSRPPVIRDLFDIPEPRKLPSLGDNLAAGD